MYYKVEIMKTLMILSKIIDIPFSREGGAGAGAETAPAPGFFLRAGAETAPSFLVVAPQLWIKYKVS